MQEKKQQNNQNIKVTVQLPKLKSEIVNQTKINRIYDILNPEKTENNRKKAI